MSTMIEALLGEQVTDWFRRRGSDPIDFILVLATIVVAVTMCAGGVAYLVAMAGRSLGYG